MASQTYKRVKYHFPDLVAARLEIEHVNGKENQSILTLNQQDETISEPLVDALLLQEQTRWANSRREHPEATRMKIILNTEENSSAEHVLFKSVREITSYWKGMEEKMKQVLQENIVTS